MHTAVLAVACTRIHYVQALEDVDAAQFTELTLAANIIFPKAEKYIGLVDKSHRYCYILTHHALWKETIGCFLLEMTSHYHQITLDLVQPKAHR